MAGNKGRGQKAAKKNYYNSYNYEKNRKRRLQRHLKTHPGDKQAEQALSNIHHRGPKPSKDRLGWINRSETLSGFVSDKKQDKAHIYADVSGKNDAAITAWMAAHVRKVERQIAHEREFGKGSKK